ncbi:MAG: putative sugar nucleotidyl transferase [Planctomycetota bacterium]|nr:putative sugar nucleotidyl transferase [Planctomycetota bacterium]
MSTRTPCILFDDGLGTLAPLTDLRAAMDIRTGVLTTFERVNADARLAVSGLIVPEPLAELTRERHRVEVNPATVGPGTLVVNARVPLPPLDAALQLAAGERLVSKDGTTIACRCAGADSQQTWHATWHEGRAIAIEGVGVLERPWDVRRFRDACIAADLARLCGSVTMGPMGFAGVAAGVVQFGTHAVRIDAGARVYPTVVLDTEGGPIHIGVNAVVRPGSVLIGPCAIGPGSTVLDQSLIKAQTAIGPSCKVAGEVGGTIIQGFSNKAHDGHLGDSYLGEWVNLGAGTTNSNLLNTYGEVIAKATPGGSNERTGIQFLGAIIGDHVKTAICTRIMTGSVLHTGGMFAQSAAVAGTTLRFAWATDAGVKAFRLDKFMEVARAAMKRRGLSPSDAYAKRMHELHHSPLSAAVERG